MSKFTDKFETLCLWLYYLLKYLSYYFTQVEQKRYFRVYKRAVGRRDLT